MKRSWATSKKLAFLHLSPCQPPGPGKTHNTWTSRSLQLLPAARARENDVLIKDLVKSRQQLIGSGILVTEGNRREPA